MSFAILTVLFDRIIDGDVLVEQELPVEGLNGSVCRLETVKRHEGVALGLSTGRISRHLGQPNDAAKGGESLVEQALIDGRVETADEQVGTDVDLLAVVGGFVDADGLAVQLETIHDFASIVGILFGLEFGKGVALMGLRDAILG